MALLLGLAAWMLIGFEGFFQAFHGVFFESGTWVFSYSDTLIRLFPLPFWQDAGLIVAGGLRAGSVRCSSGWVVCASLCCQDLIAPGNHPQIRVFLGRWHAAGNGASGFHTPFLCVSNTRDLY